MPHKEDFVNPENFEFALAEYKHKLDVYQARLNLKKASDETLAEELKDVFRIFRKKFFAGYDVFCPQKDDGTKLGFKPALVAEYIARGANNSINFKTDIDTGILYFYNGRSWIANAEPYLEFLIQVILGEENRQSHYNNIAHDLKALTYTELHFSKTLACENGLLNPETLEFSDFSEKEMPFHQIPVKYDKEAKCPNWEAFIKQVVSQDDLPTIQEWSGFLLLPDYRFQKLLWIQGEGRNGKGVWQRTMEAILGEKNVSSVGLEEFDGNHRFAMRQLYGKLFNPCSEPSTVKILETTLSRSNTHISVMNAPIVSLALRN